MGDGPWVPVKQMKQKDVRADNCHHNSSVTPASSAPDQAIPSTSCEASVNNLSDHSANENNFLVQYDSCESCDTNIQVGNQASISQSVETQSTLVADQPDHDSENAVAEQQIFHYILQMSNATDSSPNPEPGIVHVTLDTERKAQVDKCDSSKYLDPAHFCNYRITSASIELWLQRDRPTLPCDSYIFPFTGSRACSRSWFLKTMPNGQRRSRKWLSYSESRDALFCIDCMLFSGPKKAADKWARQGYSDWAHATRDIDMHEASPEHRTSEIGRFTYNSKSRIDNRLATISHSTTTRNRRVAYVSIKCLKYLSTEMTAIRGHDGHDGKFLHLFREFAEFDASSAAYLEMLSNMRGSNYMRKPEINLISPLNIRRLLITMRDMVVDTILSQVKKKNVCSIISDGTQDESKLEAQCVILRYLEESPSGLRPVERLIDIFTTGDTSGENLSNTIVGILDKKKVQLSWLVSQSYDGAGNVSGRYTGLKTLILAKAPRALYIWCSAHRLNLVVEAVLKCSSDVSNVLGIVQELYNFFLGHKRHSILVKMQEDAEPKNKHTRTLKRVSDTTRSWRSAEDGTNTLLECFDSVVAALCKLATESHDSHTTTSANGLFLKLQDARCIMTLIFLQRILRITGPVSRILQSISSDLSIVVTLIDGCIKQLTQLRDKVDEFFEDIKSEMSRFCAEHNIDPQLKSVRPRKRRKMSDEQANDERITVAESAFKIDVVIRCLDVLLSQFNDRFSEGNMKLLQEMRHFFPASLISSSAITAGDIEHLCRFYGFDADIVARERNDFLAVYKSMSEFIDTKDLIQASLSRSLYSQQKADPVTVGLMEDEEDETAQLAEEHNTWINRSFVKPMRALDELSSFPNLSCLMKILATIAVTSCSAERTMSRVKIIKNRLRSTMLDDWFSALTILASERDIVDALNTEEVIDRFALLSDKLQKNLK